MPLTYPTFVLWCDSADGRKVGGVMKHNTSIETRIAPATVFGVNSSNGLFSFDSDTPGTLSATTAITGLAGGEIVKAMDFRPATGELYAIGISGAAAPFTGRLYKIDPATAAATIVGAGPFSTTLSSGAGIGMDFNPTVDRIRFTTDADISLRINPNDGIIAATDTNITVANTIAALAYSNNYPGTASTTLYAIDYINDDLFTIGGLNSNPSPNSGVGVKVGNITVTTDNGVRDRVGFDILTTIEGNTAFYTGSFGGLQNLYTLNLTTAAATLLSAIGGGAPVFDIAVQPAAALTFTDGKSFTYTDGDGDLVTVKTTAGTLKSSQFSWFASADGTRHELTSMNIAGDATFTGANLTFSAQKTATEGNGRVDVGSILASAVNLGAVKVGGSLGDITAGTGDAIIPAVKSIDALSFGRANGGNDATATASTITGNVPLLKVKGDITGSHIIIDGKAGSIFIGGSIIGTDATDSGRLVAFQGTKSVVIGGSIIGGSGNGSGFVQFSGTNGTVKVGGSIIGMAGNNSGLLDLNSQKSTSLTVGGSIIGGDGTFSGKLSMFAIGSVTIGGSIVGGDGVLSARCVIGDVAKLKISGSIIGSEGSTSGSLYFGKATSVTLGGSVVAGDGVGSGLVSGTSADTFKLGGSIIGGTAENSANVGPGTVGAFTLGGSLIGGKATGGYSGQLHFATAKSVLIKGSVTGQQGAAPALIGFAGKTAPTTAAESIAVGSLTIKGSVTNAELIFGEGFAGTVSQFDVGAGKLSIGGDFTASSITAGVGRGVDKSFGTDDDMPGMATNASIKASIASIIIKGRATGTLSDGDHYGIVAESVGTISIAGRTLPLTAAAQDNVLVGIYGDFRVRELAFA